jgi:hypothetical protein
MPQTANRQNDATELMLGRFHADSRENSIAAYATRLGVPVIGSHERAIRGNLGRSSARRDRS